VTKRTLTRSQKSARAVDKAISQAPSRRSPTESVDWKLAEQVLLQGDLGKLSNEDQTKYVLGLCRSLGLNPLTQPFQWIVLDGKLTLYARKNCTDQLRAIHNIDIRPVSAGALEIGGQQYADVYTVTVQAVLPTGRTDIEVGAVSIRGLSGLDLANAVMRASTKAKRRATLSISGLSFLDESELDSVRFAMPERSDEVRRVQPPPALTPPTPKTFTPSGSSSAPAAPVPVQAVATAVIPATKPPIEEVAPPNPAPPPAATIVSTTTPVQPVRGPLPPPARPSAPPVAMPSRPRPR